MINSKSIYNFTGALLMAGALLVGCSKSSDGLETRPVAPGTTEESEQTNPAATKSGFTLVVGTTSGKALADNGDGTLVSTWTEGDSVSVYNLTTKEKYKEKLYAQETGSTTSFKGTFEGNFNQGDELELTFIGDAAYAEQDGTLEGVATKSDYAVAVVAVSEINPDDCTVSTEEALFVKQQAVVKFSIQNRKEPAEAVKVTSLKGSVALSDEETYEINVTPAAATDELYVAVPAFSEKTLTLEAAGEDGYAYRLIVDNVSFDNGNFYERTLQMKRKANVKAPVAKTGLVYNTTTLALVDSAHVVWTVNNAETILDGDVDKDGAKCVVSYFVKREVDADVVPDAPAAEETGWKTTIPAVTHAGTYYIWTKMAGNYDYESADVCETPVKVVVAKATATVSLSAVSTELTYNTQAQAIIAEAAKVKIDTVTVTSAKDTLNNACTVQYAVIKNDMSGPEEDDARWSDSYSTVTDADIYFVWVRVVGNADISDIATACAFNKTIAAKTVSSPAITLDTSSYTYDGNEKTPTVTVKDGETVIPSTEYTVSYSNNKNAGTATVTVTDNTNGNYTVSGSTTFTISKATPTVTAPTAKTSLTYTGDAMALVLSGSTTGGTLQYSLDGTNWGTAVPTATNAGNYTVQYKVVGGDYYNDVDAASVNVTIRKATGYISLYQSTLSTVFGSAVPISITESHGGDLSLSFSGDTGSYQVSDILSNAQGGKYFIVMRTANAAQLMQVKVTCAGTDNYSAASTTLTVN